MPSQQPSPLPGPKAVDLTEPTFDDFWKAYPRKTGKAASRAMWEKITNGGMKTRTLCRDSGNYLDITIQATPREIMAGAEFYRASQMMPDGWQIRDGGRYVAHPTTWLNQGRWEDYT